MNGFQDFMYYRNRGNSPATTPRGGGEPGFFNKHRSMDNYFTTNLPSPLSTSHRSPSKTMTHNTIDGCARRKNSTPIMFSNSNGFMKPPAVEKRLECTLEELCFGCTRKIKITKDVVTNTGQIVPEEELLTIKVKPGWKKGTKITFEGMGNERPGTYPADITFIISEKRHPVFRREGDDLELAVEIPLVQALTGCTISVPLLGGEKMTLTLDDIIYPGFQKIIAGQGMPVSKEAGRRQNLKIIFLVDFPSDLTDEQRSDAFTILQDSEPLDDDCGM